MTIFRVLLSLLLFFTSSILFSQVIDDPLQGSTIGVKVGGTITSEGYKPGIGENHILYNVPQQIQNGYVEVQVKGFNFNDFSDADSNSQTSFFVMYDGRGVPEPLQYIYDYRNNYFRFETVYRSAKPNSTSGNRFKGKIHTAADTPERINSTHAVFPNDSEHPMDWAIEPNGLYTSWNPSQWYTIRTEWNNTTKDYKIYRDGVEVWHNKKDKGIPYSGDDIYSSTSPYPWLPVDFRIWLGSGPRQYSSKLANLVYRNFKVVDLSGNVIPDTLNISPNSFDLPYTSGTTYLNVNSNIDWDVVVDVDWITLNPNNGTEDQEISISYEANTSNSERTAKVTITGNNISREVNINQVGQPLDYINIDEQQINVDFKEGSAVLNISSNTNWAVVTESEWVNFSQQNGFGDTTLVIYYTQNNSNVARSAIITLQNDSLFVTATLNQQGSNYYINILPKVWSVSNNSGQVTYSVESNHNYSIYSLASWLSTSITDTSGNAIFTVNFNANLDTSDRTGKIFIESEYIIDSVLLIQEGANPVEVMVSINPSESGIVEGTGVYGEGSDVNLIATPNSGWKFDNWTENNNILSTDSVLVIKKNKTSRSIVANFSTLTKIEENKSIREEYFLSQNYPNPFNPSTTISFNLPEAAKVILKIYNSLGQELYTLTDKNFGVGHHGIDFNASNLTSGIYVYSMVAIGNSGKKFVDSKKLILLK